MRFSHDPKLNELAARAEAGERLSFADGVALFRTEDLHALGRLADMVRRRRHGRGTYYNVNRHFNPTNVCYADCKFCGFFRTPRQPDAYTHNIEDSLRIAGDAVREGATELHIVGGLNTKLPFSYFTDLLSSLKANYPQLHLKAWTMVELDHFARFYKMSDEEVITRLKEAGMDSCPGGGAEIFREPTRSMICAHKCDADRWLSLSGKVHAAGLKTNAVSRLMLDNFAHIKAYWVMLGKRLAQVALHYGANDLDGTITEGGELTESYSVESGGEVKMSKQEIVALIEDAGLEAVERDTLYNPVVREAVGA